MTVSPQRSSRPLADVLQSVRGHVESGEGLIEALDKEPDLVGPARDAAIAALYRAIPWFWRWLAGPVSRDTGEIEDGVARYIAYPRREDAAASRARKKVILKLIDRAIAKDRR